MIYFLEADIAEFNSQKEAELEELFSKLADSNICGNHLVIMTKKTSDWAAEKLELSKRQKASIKKIGETFSTTAGLLSTASTYLKIKLGNQKLKKTNGCYTIGHLEFIKGDYSNQKTTVVVEDIVSDRKLYTRIFEETKKISCIPNINYSVVHGGGARILDTVKNAVKDQKVVICLVDSDKLSPFCSYSKTAKKILEYEQEHFDKLLFSCFPTICRELENHLPYTLLKEIYCDVDSKEFEILDKAINQSNSGSPFEDCFWLFFDIKQGFDGEKLIHKVRNRELSKQALEWYCDRLNVTQEELPKIAFSPFNENVMKRFEENEIAKSQFHDFCRSSYWDEIYQKFFEKVLWFIVSGAGLRV